MLHQVGTLTDAQRQAIDKQEAAVKAARQRVAETNRQIKKLQAKIKDNDLSGDARKQAQRDLRQAQKDIKQLQKQLKNKQSADTPTGPLAMGVRDDDAGEDCRVNIKGDAHNLGPAVPRGTIEVVDFTGDPRVRSTGSGRLELANWITDPRNPLTARVMVNRIWLHLFGQGIVRTVDNFGQMGDRPTHPQLLDHLASRFIEQGWSVKQLIRVMVLTRTYQLAHTHDARNYEVDPDNVLLWRSSRRRLEAEAIRDALLMASGRLNIKPPTGSPMDDVKTDEIGRNASIDESAFSKPMRSVYVPIVRQFEPDMFTTFDFPEPSETKGERDVTTVAPQALFLMNSKFVIDQAEAAAERAIKATNDNRERAVTAYRVTLGRTPTRNEVQRITAYVAEEVSRASQQGKKADPKAEQAAWAQVYHALFASAEFRYVQ